MKKLIAFIMPVKFVAGGILFGLIGMYMVAGTINARLTGAEFEYSVPFSFILQGAVLAIIVAALVEVFFGETVIKKWRFFKRALFFGLSLIILIVVGVLISFTLRGDAWVYLWLIGIIVITMGIIVAGATEIYYRKTGERYTELLRAYKEKQDM